MTSRPQLFGTIFMLVLATLLVSQLIAAILLVVIRPPPPAALNMAAIVAEIQAAPPAKDPRLRVEREAPPPRPDPSDGDTAQRLARMFATRLGIAADDVVVDLARIQRGRLIYVDLGPPGRPNLQPSLVGEFALHVRAPDGSWTRYTQRGEGVFETVEQRYVILFLLGALMMLPPAWWLARRLARPFAQLADQAERLGLDPAANVEPITGPQEAARASRAVVQMARRLSNLVADRTQMVGALAHDLRTPLTRLTFRVHDLPQAQRTPIDADLEEMEAMVASTLDYVRGTGTQSPRGPVDVAALVAGLVEEQKLAKRSATLDPAPPMVVIGDRLGLKRLFQNIFDNALVYGGVAHARLRREGQTVVVEVADAGPGIPESERALVFEPFYRAEKSRNRNTGGIGLGLSFARTVARAHAGEIQLVSGTPRGLVVRVVLPLAQGADTDDSGAQQGALHG
jgi:signal transduction histidine kinase